MSRQMVVVQERHRLVVYQVMNYIEQHLGEKLTLQQTAELVSYSPFHFHRLFQAVTGENLNVFMKRIRLERALTQIVLVLDRSVSDIAIDCGFSSIGDFSRSFKQHFGTTASSFREQWNGQNRKICEMDRKITERYFDTTYYNKMYPDGSTRMVAKRSLKVTVKQLPSYRVVYHRCIGNQDPSSDQERIRQAFENVSVWAKSRRNPTYQSMNIGIPYPLPLLREYARWRYDACRTIPANMDGDLGINSRWLAGGLYGVLSLEKQSNVYDSILDLFFYEWLPENGYTLDDSRPLLELYRVSDVGHAVYVDCCIPILEIG